MTRRREQAPLTSRRAARELAFRVLFESAQGGTTIDETLARAETGMRLGDDAYPTLNEEALGFARSLIHGYEANRERIDALLRDTIQGWTFTQMAQTDLNILRLAAYELSVGDQPAPPVIESAVRIARKFGGDDSGRFVNGVLAGLARKLDAQRASAPDGERDGATGDAPDAAGEERTEQ